MDRTELSLLTATQFNSKSTNESFKLKSTQWKKTRLDVPIQATIVDKSRPILGAILSFNQNVFSLRSDNNSSKLFLKRMYVSSFENHLFNFNFSIVINYEQIQLNASIFSNRKNWNF